MKQKDKDLLVVFFIAVFVSCLFYYVHRNSVFTYLDLYLVEFGIFIPFVLFLGLLVKHRLEEPCYIWGY